MIRVFSYLGLLAAVVIILILAVQQLKGMSSVVSSGSTGEQRATKQLNSDGDDEKIDPASEMKDTVRGALAH